jgi:3-oxoadipate enol-lactonase
MPVAFIQNQDVEIFFEDSGTGPPIVMAHSFLCSGEMWREQVPALRAAFRVINPDLRGHGRSGHVLRAFSLYDLVSDVIAVLDHLGVGRAIWCGLSIGGMVALRAALTHPDRVAALILLDTDAGPETGLRKLKYRAMGAGAAIVGMRPFLPAIAPLMFGPTTRRENPSLVSEWKGRFASLHVPSVLRGLEALVLRDSLLARLGEIDAPVLVLVGEEDASLPPAVSRRLHDRLRHSAFGLVRGAGHLSSLEQPAQVTQAILTFLSANAR